MRRADKDLQPSPLIYAKTQGVHEKRRQMDRHKPILPNRTENQIIYSMHADYILSMCKENITIYRQVQIVLK